MRRRPIVVSALAAVFALQICVALVNAISVLPVTSRDWAVLVGGLLGLLIEGAIIVGALLTMRKWAFLVIAAEFAWWAWQAFRAGFAWTPFSAYSVLLYAACLISALLYWSRMTWDVGLPTSKWESADP